MADETPDFILHQPGFVEAWLTELPPERARIPARRYIAEDAVAAREAEALEAGIRAGLLAAAEAYATHRIIGLAQYAPKGWRHTVYNDLRAIAADPAKVAAIAAKAKKRGGQPTEYERKVAQMKKDFPSGI